MASHAVRPLGFAGALAAGWLFARAGSAWAQGCAMCGAGLAEDPAGRAISWSILFLMATPYAIVGAIGSWLFLTHRRAAGRQRAAMIDLTRLGGVPAGERSGGDVA